MSQWNNAFAFNNQYQGQQASNMWNGDLNAQQHGNQNPNYYPNRHEYEQQQGSQYVSFNDFLNQMQGSRTVQALNTNYTNPQYPNYPANQYNNYTNVPSTSQSNPSFDTYQYDGNAAGNTPNGVDAYQSDSKSQYKAESTSEATNYTDDVAFKSNLTATATEFVPKATTFKQPANPKPRQMDQPESSTSSNGYNHRKNNSANERNWRDRPSSSTHLSEKQNGSNHRSHDPNPRNQESNYKNGEQSPRNQESHYKNQEPRPRNKDRNHETSPRNNDTNYRNSEGSSRYQEPKENSNNKNQSKSNSKSRNKQSDDGRTFYNSSASKSSQDVRIGRGEGSSGRQEGRKNWVGSQRVRPAERNYMDDEQFANNYHQYREEKQERVSKVQTASSPVKNNRNKHFANNNDHANTDMTQRERLSEQLDKGTLECLVCCERVKQTDTVWSCGNCYHVLHLRCIRKWAMSSMLEGKWRCPACQNQSDMVPTDYRCMCGAARNPEWQRGAGGAHTCGRACARARTCPHPCTLLCHPGPCPPCQATVSKQCGCGAETRSVQCSSKLPQTCAGTCRRKLNCGVHECGQPCHEGPCADCAEIIQQVCHCPAAAVRAEPCTGASAGTRQWACGDACGRVLACGAHVCRAACHAPPCAACPAAPRHNETCPCGKMLLEKNKRKVCTDPIPLCGNICAKPLTCGPQADRHFCKSECHHGACPVCPDKTTLQCRCGQATRDVLCRELAEMMGNVFCQKKCNKKLSCGRHRCRTLCCATESHRCPAVCGRSLPCQLHRCEELCHTGHCPPCPRVSFEELPCACGAQRVLPPVRCGTRPPPCTAPCRRARPCRHPPHHACHAGDCPPCVVLSTKRCHGDHEERKTIPCSQEEFSCGLPCGKPLPCGKHTCIKVCHKGPCDTAKCTQPCMEKRPSCGHPCGAPCHGGGGPSACPSTAPCRRPVRAVCPCARRSQERACHDNMAQHNKMLSALAASKVQEGGSVDLSELTRPSALLKTLECDDECRVEQRTRQMALALQIRNPDVSAKLAPRYSDHVRQWAQRDGAFARHVHDKLTELVQLAKKSKQKTRSHSFPSMNWQKRQFIHELCEHFGCESVAYDAEPNRNVVATADKEKSWLPAMSVLEVLAREAGKRRVPGPVLRPAFGAAAAAVPASTSAASAKITSGWATLTSTNAWAARSQPKPAQSEPKIDYFDNPPE